MSNSTVLITGALTGIGCATAMAFAKERAPSVSTFNDGARTHGPAAASGINVILSRNGQSAPAAHETQSNGLAFVGPTIGANFGFNRRSQEEAMCLTL
jgi:NAD(P)-dependent dehydrogenase (short-subunit alcohol dehydrogenase family)